MRKNKFNRGITLIALVITIVVLLILAGISISLILGENGILTKAKDSVLSHRKAEEEQRVQFVIADAQARSKSDKITYKNLKDAADNEFGKDNYELKYNLEEKQFELTVKETGNMYAIKAEPSDVVNDLQELAKDSSGNITEENLINAAKEIFGDDYNVNYNSTDKQFEISLNGNGEEKIIIKDNIVEPDSGEETPRNLITASMIKNSASTYYGKNVNYLPTVRNYDSNTNENLSGWKVFYADDNNIYLISENFINCNIIPGNAYGNRPHYVLTGANAGSSPKVNFDNYDLVISYSGSDAITSSNPAKPWLDQYYNNNFYSQCYNMRVTSYLLDTNAWSDFAINGIADYAIGSPTLQMVAASYNTLHPYDIGTEATSNVGYRVRNGENMDTWNNGLDRTNSLYVASDTLVLWLATPSYQNENNLVVLYPGDSQSGAGLSGNGIYSDNNGLRPVICLNSSVKLELSNDNITYNLVTE